MFTFLSFRITSKTASLMAFFHIDQSKFISEVFWILKLTFASLFFMHSWNIGQFFYFPLKLVRAFTTLLFSFCIGLVLNTTITATTAPYCNGFFMRILDYQISAINYVLLSKDICKGVFCLFVWYRYFAGMICGLQKQQADEWRTSWTPGKGVGRVTENTTPFLLAYYEQNAD
jgi:hypothetical protein